MHDLVDGLILAMERGYVLPVNIGTPHEFTIKNFAEIIRGKIQGCKSKIVYRDATEDDPQQRRPDISRAEQELGWKPLFPFDQGIDETIEYFRGVVEGDSGL